MCKGTLVSALFVCALTASVSQGHFGGYVNVLQMGGEVESYVLPGSGGNAGMNGTEGGGMYTLDLSSSEYNYAWDWHGSANPTRDLRQLGFFTVPYNNLPVTFNLYRGDYNAGSGQTDWTLAHQITSPGGFTFKPVTMDLPAPILGATGVKVQWVSGTEYDRNTRRLPSVCAFDATPIGPLVSPVSAASSLTFPGTIGQVVDEAANSPNPSSSQNDDGVAQVEWVQVAFAEPVTLDGVAVNASPVHDPTQYGWKSWQVKDVPGGTVLATAQVYPNADGSTPSDRFQILKFDQPMTLSSFVLEGPFGASSAGQHPFQNSYLGEIWGIEYVPEDVEIIPEPATMALLGLGGCAVLWRKKRRTPRRQVHQEGGTEMRRHWLVSIILVCGLAASVAQAGFVGGQNPFVDIAGTGTATANNTGFGVPEWTDQNYSTAPYRGPLPTDAMYYEETWTEAKDIGAVVLDLGDRQAGGDVYKATTSGGPFSTLVGSFSSAGGCMRQPVAGDASGAYGIRVEVNSTTTTYYQMGNVEFHSTDPGPNLALGETTMMSGGSVYGSGSVTDEDYLTDWRADPNASENWVGYEFAAGPTDVRCIRVASTRHGAGTTFNWSDYDVQVKQGGVWVTLGRASAPAGANVYWVDFEESLSVEGIRLYGSDQGGNNPTANDGKIIDDIAAFDLPPTGPPIPEPATMALLGLGGCATLLRKKRRTPRRQTRQEGDTREIPAEKP